MFHALKPLPNQPALVSRLEASFDTQDVVQPLLGLPVERKEQGYQLFSVVYFSRGTLPQKSWSKGTTKAKTWLPR